MSARGWRGIGLNNVSWLYFDHVLDGLEPEQFGPWMSMVRPRGDCHLSKLWTPARTSCVECRTLKVTWYLLVLGHMPYAKWRSNDRLALLNHYLLGFVRNWLCLPESRSSNITLPGTEPPPRHFPEESPKWTAFCARGQKKTCMLELSLCHHPLGDHISLPGLHFTVGG